MPSHPTGKKKAYTALVQCRTSLAGKWGPQRKDFGGGYGFPGFYRVFVSTTGLESFSLRQEKFSKRFSFGGDCVHFFLLCPNFLDYIRADFFWEGDATKDFSVKKKGFSVKRGEAIQWMRGLVRISTGKAIQWRDSGHSLNRRTLKFKSCCPHPLPENQLLLQVLSRGPVLEDLSEPQQLKTQEKTRQFKGFCVQFLWGPGSVTGPR